MATQRKVNAIPENRMKRMRRIPRENRGPRDLGLWMEPERVVGPGEPPAAFLTPTTSRSEWIPYWSLAKIFDDPRDPRQPPYSGGASWGYQVSFEGGRSVRGGSVMDYVIYLPSEIVGIRLQTERFHIAVSPAKRASDRMQAMSLEKYMRVEDLYEQDIIADRTGNAAIRRMIELLGGWERVSPLVSGTFRRVRPESM